MEVWKGRWWNRRSRGGGGEGSKQYYKDQGSGPPPGYKDACRNRGLTGDGEGTNGNLGQQVEADKNMIYNVLVIHMRSLIKKINKL